MAETWSKSCRNCGVPLDPDEKCDCQKLNQEKKTEHGGDGNKNTGYALAAAGPQKAHVYGDKIGKISGL